MRLVYFASVRQRLGTAEETIVLPPAAATVADLAAHLAARGDAYATVFADPRQLRAAINQTHARFDAKVGDGDEVAFFPPMTGG